MIRTWKSSPSPSSPYVSDVKHYVHLTPVHPGGYKTSGVEGRLLLPVLHAAVQLTQPYVTIGNHTCGGTW